MQRLSCLLFYDKCSYLFGWRLTKMEGHLHSCIWHAFLSKSDIHCIQEIQGIFWESNMASTMLYSLSYMNINTWDLWTFISTFKVLSQLLYSWIKLSFCVECSSVRVSVLHQQPVSKDNTFCVNHELWDLGKGCFEM